MQGEVEHGDPDCFDRGLWSASDAATCGYSLAVALQDLYGNLNIAIQEAFPVLTHSQVWSPPLAIGSKLSRPA